MADNRSWATHKIHQWGHEYNSCRKSEGKSGIECSKVYRSSSPGKARKEGNEWSKEVDDRRAQYHAEKAA